MRIDNLQLDALAAVLQEGTFELAARRLNVTPSAISQRVKALEDRIGQVLIQRAVPCRPTGAGQVLLRFASEVSLLESEVFAALGDTEHGTTRAARIPIVVNADSLDSWFNEVLAAVAASGAMTLDIRVEDQDHSAELMREGVVMAGISASASPIQGCRVERLGTMRYLAMASPGFIATHFSNGVSRDALNNAPMLVFSRKDALQTEFTSRLIDAPISPPLHYMPTTRSFLEAACCGLGWGMIPLQMAGNLIQAGKLQEFAPNTSLDVPLFWHRSKINAAPLELLSSLVYKAAKNQLLPGLLPDTGRS